MPDFIPRRDAELLAWSNNFDQKISTSPQDYGMTAAQAAEYAGLHQAYAATLAATSSPALRTPGGIVAKDAARAALVKLARRFCYLVRGTATVTVAMKVELGLKVRSAHRRRYGPPTQAPQMFIVSILGRTVRVRLADVGSPSSRAIPRGVQGAVIHGYVGEEPPTSLSRWSILQMTSRLTVDINFPADLPPGTRVWLTAEWFNNAPGRTARSGHGPLCAPIGTWISPAAAPAIGGLMKKAA